MTTGTDSPAPRVFLPAIASGLMLWACFFPLNLGPLAFVALVPWLSLVRAENVSRWRRYAAAFVGALCFFGPALQWVRVASPPMYASWVFLALYCSLLYSVALFLLRRLDRLLGWPLAFTVPIVFVALDYFRMHFPTGFPFLEPLGIYQLIGFGWYMLGYTQHATLPLLQLADLGGVYLVTFLVCAFNGATYEWVIRQPWVRRVLFRWPPDHRIGFFREMWVSAAATCGVVFGVAYGITKIDQAKFENGPRIAAIQADIEQDIKMKDERKLFVTYDELCRIAARRADLVIWPETCNPMAWHAVRSGNAPRNFELLVNHTRDYYRDLVSREYRTHVLFGLSTFEWDGDKENRYNSAALFSPQGEFLGRYDKMHLVPMGEYVPLEKTFPWLHRFTPYEEGYSCRPGETYTRFPLKIGERTYTFGVLICYEDSDPFIARQYVRSEPVDFLVNISNDGWFKGTEEHEQHLAICRFRAVEARRSIVRAVNMGISAFIDSNGRVQALPGDNWAHSVKLDGTVTDKVKLDKRDSFYARTGDWLPAFCWAFLIAMHLLAMIKARRQRT